MRAQGRCFILIAERYNLIVLAGKHPHQRDATYLSQQTKQTFYHLCLIISSLQKVNKITCSAEVMFVCMFRKLFGFFKENIFKVQGSSFPLFKRKAIKM